MCKWFWNVGNVWGKIVFDKLITLMKTEGLTTYRIRKDKIISEATLQSIRKDKSITTDSLAALCEALNCQPGDLMEYVPDKSVPTVDDC